MGRLGAQRHYPNKPLPGATATLALPTFKMVLATERNAGQLSHHTSRRSRTILDCDDIAAIVSSARVECDRLKVC